MVSSSPSLIHTPSWLNIPGSSSSGTFVDAVIDYIGGLYGLYVPGKEEERAREFNRHFL